MSYVTARHKAFRGKSPSRTSTEFGDYDNGKTKKQSNLPVIVLGGIILLCFGIVMMNGGDESIPNRLQDRLHTAGHPATDHKESNVRKAKGNKHDSVAEPVVVKSNNPYEGWVPKVSKARDRGQKGCDSWRTCFKDNKCGAKCRDSVHDFGEPPPRPGYTPKSGLDKETMQLEAQKVPWVPDVWIQRRMLKAGKDQNGDPFPPPLVTVTDRELCENIGTFGGNNDDHVKLINEVPIRGMPMLMEWSPAQAATKKMKRQPKVMCIVYTMEENHATNIRVIRETWGPGCDGFLAFSTRDDPRIPAISIPHDGQEEYSNMWQKIRSIWRFVGTHYLEDFDFFFQGGEDLYVMPQNLRNFLADEVSDPAKDDYFGGRRFQWGRGSDVFFNSGGAGYALSQATLRKFVDTGLDHKDCFPEKHSSMEDVFVAKCLKEVFDIGVVDTRDDKGRERFHPFGPAGHYNWRPPPEGKRDWYQDYNMLWPPKLGKDCCAPDSISFHYMKKPAMVRHIHALLYYCDDFK